MSLFTKIGPFVQIGRPHFKDTIDHFKKSQIVFLWPALIVFIKIESRKDWQIFIWELCRRPKRKQI